MTSRLHAVLLASVPGEATPPSDCRLTALDGSRSWNLSLSAEPSPGSGEVEDVWELHRGFGPFPALVQFTGPRSPMQVAADRFAGTERVAPAAASVPGTRAALCLRAADGGMVVLASADSVEALEASSRAIQSTPLLPGEDPALLGGPDSWTACRLDGADHLTAALVVTAASAS